VHDLDFHEPAEKSFPEHQVAESGRSKLAVVSLVFGILGLTVLPFLGSLIAIVTGLVSLGEIRASGGRIGGRPLAKAGLWLGFVWFFLAAVTAAILMFFLVLRTEARVNVEIPATPAPAPHSPGVKMANELGTQSMADLKRLGVEDEETSGELICYYTNEMTDDGEPESAALTTKQVVFMKGPRKTAFELKDVDALMDSTAYRQKYTPNSFDMSK